MTLLTWYIFLYLKIRFQFCNEITSVLVCYSTISTYLELQTLGFVRVRSFRLLVPVVLVNEENE